MRFECKFCDKTYPMEKHLIPEIIAHLKTHQKMSGFTEKLTCKMLEVTIKNQNKIKKATA